MIVVDSNVLAARILTSDGTRWAEQVEAKDAVWVLPPLWRYEFQNILAKSLWARQLTLKDAVNAWRQAMEQVADNELDPSPERVMEMSNHYHIASYDATFVALAMDLGVMCVTEDRELQGKFPSMAVSMRDFVRWNHGGSKVVRESRASYRVSMRRSKSN